MSKLTFVDEPLCDDAGPPAHGHMVMRSVKWCTTQLLNLLSLPNRSYLPYHRLQKACVAVGYVNYYVNLYILIIDPLQTEYKHNLRLRPHQRLPQYSHNYVPHAKVFGN